jgi:hypothetical protein
MKTNDKLPQNQPLQLHDVVCRFFGHRLSKVRPDGFGYCERCKSHEYWDSGNYGFSNRWEKAGLILMPFWFIKRKWFEFKYDIKYWYKRRFLKDDLPF